MKRLAAWLWRAWPIWMVLAVIGLHLLALRWVSLDRTLLNKLAGTSLQILGGLIVLQSIDGNLGIFKKQSLASVVVGWFMEFPLIRRHIVRSVGGAAMSTATGTATITVKRVYSTLEERVAELERLADELRVEIRAEGAAVRRQVDEVRHELLSSIESNNTDIRQLTEKIERATVGGFKQQSFGVLLAIYGAVVSVFA